MPTIPVSGVGNTPVRVTATATKLNRGLLVIADPANTATGFVGNGSAITPGTDAASGIPVFPGAWTFVPLEALFTAGTGQSDAANAYVVCGSGSNKFYFVPDGDPRLAAASPLSGGGTAGTPAGAVQSVQGVSGGTPVRESEVWQSLSAVMQFTSNDGSAPTLNGLANGSLVLSNAYDNTANRYLWLNLDLLVRGASAFTSGSTVDVWLLTALDGTNYEDGSASITPGRSPDAQFFLRNVALAQRIELPLIAVPPCKFKVLVRNSGGQAFTTSNTENVLTGYLN